MLTAKSDAMEQIMGYESGADEYIVKPIKPSEIVKVVEGFLK